MTEYCIPCIYCRRLSSTDGSVACHYGLDNGIARPCKGGDGCTVRLILSPEGKAAYIAKLTEVWRSTAKARRDPRLDDYIYDDRSLN